MQILIGALLAAVLIGVSLLTYLITADPLQVGSTVQRVARTVSGQLEREPGAAVPNTTPSSAATSSSELEGGASQATTSGSGSSPHTDTELATSSDQNGHPLLTDEQETILRRVGIDPARLPDRATPAQISCFRGVVGDERYNAIVSGGTPTLGEVWRARTCL